MPRRAGILVPLFSIPSSRSWGIGEIGDIRPLVEWLEAAGQRILQLLPINEMPPDETSPYSALSAMAIDPQFISVADLEDFQALGGEAALGPDLRARLARLRERHGIDYAGVRELKQIALHGAFARFKQEDWRAATPRAARFRRYVEEEASWLEDYALFRALHARHDERAWMEWPTALRDRDRSALSDARGELADDILFRQYLQWVAHDQWQMARNACREVALFGDLPFMVNRDSADVWARQDEFRLDGSVGVPPDAFSATGQDWGLPAYRWDVLAERDFDWLRERARRNAALFDGYRVDHLVGFYRTYFRPLDGGSPQFTPSDEEAQTKLGERVLQVFREPGTEIIAEDLGVVPDFVRASLARQSIPGYRVLRWERHWHAEGQPFKDPAEYPESAVVTSGTHDTETLAAWWDGAPLEERQAVLAIPSVRARLTSEGQVSAAALARERVRDVLVETLVASGADLLILPIQDVFGWRDRINQPATVADSNWTWRMPWPVDRLLLEPDAVDAAARLRSWTSRYGR
jgi:4-alpha-glucanotransferase